MVDSLWPLQAKGKGGRVVGEAVGRAMAGLVLKE